MTVPLLTIPMIDSAYEGTNWGADNPDCRMKAAARVESYRGFVFASLANDGPSLEEFLGKARIALDNMCDRSPEGEIEIVPNCFRVVQRSNWKIFIENQIDALHPAVTHQSTGAAAREIELDLQEKYGEAPLSYHMLSAFATLTVEDWNAFETKGYPYGHTSVGGYMKLRPSDPESLEYERLLEKAYGKERMEEILDVPIHHMMYYPGLGIQPQLQQLRVVRPLSVDRMLTEIWYFRLKGAPEAIHQRALDYYNLVNSPATMINADDMENFWKCQQGLGSKGNDWVSFHRHFGHDLELDGVMVSPPDRGNIRNTDAQSDPGLEKIHGGISMENATQKKVAQNITHEIQQSVEQFLYQQSELLDAKRWQDYIDLFADDGVYWMPANADHEHWEGVPSIFIEDKNTMTIRMKRVLHPEAWSQVPIWETNHIVGNVVDSGYFS